MREIILIRGLPGSGKTTLAKQMAKEIGAAHVEADDFFVGKDGVYRFDGERIGDAHKWCQDQAFTLLNLGYPVIVSNTFIRLWEMKQYYEIAAALGCSVRVIVATGNFDNTHGVSKEKVEKMRRAWQN